MAIGSYTLNKNISGHFNTAIGEGAGYSSTGSNNIFIGYQAGYDYTENNKLIIGKSRGGTDPIIEGDLLTNSLIINGDLEVTGELTTKLKTRTINYSPMDIVNVKGNADFKRIYKYIYSTIPQNWFAVSVKLPEGAKITSMKAFFKDNSTANIGFKLYKTPKYDGSDVSLGYMETSGSSTAINNIYKNIKLNNIIDSDYYYFIFISNQNGTWPGNSDLHVRAIEVKYVN